MACYGFMGCGGIFAPSLFFGGMCGVVISSTFNLIPQINLEPGDHMMLAVVGILTRTEAGKAANDFRPPELDPVTWCLPSNTIRELQVLLIESPSHVVLLHDKDEGSLIGLVTLHDLLRAEVSISKQSPG